MALCCPLSAVFGCLPKNKKIREEKIFAFVGKGQALLQTLVVRWLVAVCKCACPCVGYFISNTKVPAMIKLAPIAVFNVNVSPKKIIAKMIVKATLSLSMVATCETLPNCNALK